MSECCLMEGGQMGKSERRISWLYHQSIHNMGCKLSPPSRRFRAQASKKNTWWTFVFNIIWYLYLVINVCGLLNVKVLLQLNFWFSRSGAHRSEYPCWTTTPSIHLCFVSHQDFTHFELRTRTGTSGSKAATSRRFAPIKKSAYRRNTRNNIQWPPPDLKLIENII